MGHRAKNTRIYRYKVNIRPFCVVFSVPKVRLFGNQDIYVKTGSQVQLKCVVSQAVEHPSFVVWYYSKLMLKASFKFNWDHLQVSQRQAGGELEPPLSPLRVYLGRHVDRHVHDRARHQGRRGELHMLAGQPRRGQRQAARGQQ